MFNGLEAIEQAQPRRINLIECSVVAQERSFWNALSLHFLGPLFGLSSAVASEPKSSLRAPS